MRLLTNILQFQIGWFACVLGAANGMPELGTSVALVLVTVHVARSTHAANELSIVLFAGAFGLAADTALLQLGLLSFSAGALLAGVTPHWMVALWMVFATTLNISFGWLKRRRALAAALGAVAGPFAYYAGAKLGAVELSRTLPALLGIAIVWALAMPLLLWFSNRLERSGLAAARHSA